MSWFSPAVRERAGTIAGRGAIRIEARTPGSLWATVQGADRYETRFTRLGRRLLCACDCPYFLDRLAPCKHLCALALEQAGSELLSGASDIVRLSPEPDLLAASDPGRLSPELVFEYLEEPEEVDEELDEEELDEPLQRALRGTLRLGDWRSAAARVAARGQRGTLELVYFLSPGRSEHTTSVVMATRKVGGVPGDLTPARQVGAHELAHDVDRELFVMLSDPARFPYGGGHRGALNPYVATAALDRLARSERCYLVPADLRSAEEAKEWSALASGERLGRKMRQELGYDYAKLLAWPRLVKGEPFQLYLGLVAQAKREGTFTVAAGLVRGDDQRPLSDVSFHHPDGVAIVGQELVRLRSGDARWLGALLQEGQLAPIPEADLQEFVERVMGEGGASGLSLPEGYEKVTLEAPQPALDFEAPEGRKLKAQLFFDYAGRRVPSTQRAGVVFEGRRVLQRHLETERAALATLKELGFVGEQLKKTAALAASASRTASCQRWSARCSRRAGPSAPSGSATGRRPAWTSWSSRASIGSR